jgi:hypothetical protein
MKRKLFLAGFVLVLVFSMILGSCGGVVDDTQPGDDPEDTPKDSVEIPSGVIDPRLVGHWYDFIEDRENYYFRDDNVCEVAGEDLGLRYNTSGGTIHTWHDLGNGPILNGNIDYTFGEATGNLFLQTHPDGPDGYIYSTLSVGMYVKK